ncbi:hypothetical protein OG613_49040 (plasmid) [Streptomyces sp. NBC_00015]|uniref:hypothetical protein n=1 Tax=Streptomyces sp. NBC_00015 TaxID=2903611 RepID=UPI002F914A83
MSTTNHRVTVTARINTADTATAPTAPAPAVYTGTVYTNTAPGSFGGYLHHDPLAVVTGRDGTPLRLVFHASDRVHSHEAAASAVFDVGNYQHADDNGQSWPDDAHPVSTGDVIKVTGPDHWTVHLSVDSTGFSAVPEPATLVNRLTLNAEQAADVAHHLFEEIRSAAQEKASDDFDDYDLMMRINEMAPSDALAALKGANLPSDLTGPIAAALALLTPHFYAPRAGRTPAGDTPLTPAH